MKYSRVKDFTVIINGVGVNPEVQGNPFGEIPFFRNSDFSKEGNELYLQNSESNFSFEEIKQYGFRLAPKNSLVFSKVGESIRKNHRKFTKNISVIDNNLSAFLINKKINKQYFYWFFKTIDFANYLVPSTIPVLNTSLVKNIVVPQYSPPQQTAIANYLDHHTTKIDKEISLLEKKVEKLDEYKQALIYETVTKGLDKNVPMKDSGIEWIGIIPEHWTVKRLDKVFNKKPKKVGDVTLPTISLSFGKVVLKKGEILEETHAAYQEVKVNNILINPLNLNFDLKSLRIGISKIHGCASSGYIVLNIKKDNPDYFNYLLHIFDVLEMKKLGGGVRQTVSFEQLKKVNLITPLKNEQTQIVKYLDEQCLKIAKKKELINKKVELLKEYKQSLIYESVTGKINIGG